MKIETLGKTIWDKIKIGEVFALNGCWNICTRINDEKILILTNDWDWNFRLAGETDMIRLYSEDDLYKLPLAVQRLWRCD